MPAITGIEFRQFSAQHHNAQRNWLIVKLNTDDPNLYGLGDASPMQNATATRFTASSAESPRRGTTSWTKA